MPQMTEIWQGVVTHLHRAPRASRQMEPAERLTLIAGVGVKGDRYATGKGYYSHLPEPGRQITLFEIETLKALERDHDTVLLPDEHRRNVTVRGVALNHLVGRRFRLGETLLEATRLSTPCRHIEEVTGKTISRWLIHRCGLNCMILDGGEVRIGDIVGPE
ncbi:MAG: MOSC domain-containing protein [Paracoccaceae bacterium]